MQPQSKKFWRAELPKKEFWKQSLLCNFRLLEKTNLCNSVFSIGDKMSRFWSLYPDPYILLKRVCSIFVFTHPQPLAWSLTLPPNLCLPPSPHPPLLDPQFLVIRSGIKFVFTGSVWGLNLRMLTFSLHFIFTGPSLRFVIPVQGLNFHFSNVYDIVNILK